MKRERFDSGRVGDLVGELMSMFIDGRIPPEVVDEMMDNFKAMYKPLFEYENNDKDLISTAHSIARLIGEMDMDSEDKDRLIRELKELENEMQNG